MGETCDNCCHIGCVNGESGVVVWKKCEMCGTDVVLCSNDMTDEELDKRCNGEACGCGDVDVILCENCWRLK